MRWLSYPEGLQWIGAEPGGFAFDNERPRHRVFVEAFELASRPVTCGEYLAFIEDGGYRRPELWLSDGWATVQAQGWAAPLYWDEHEPRCSRSRGVARHRPRRARLPRQPLRGRRLRALGGRPAADRGGVGGGRARRSGRGQLCRERPAASRADDRTSGKALFGDVWEWTQSAYAPYPGFRAEAGAVGEYNGKFMCGQIVLRGGSCVSPASHLRASYRNFFPPATRWQFSGIRLAR